MAEREKETPLDSGEKEGTPLESNKSAVKFGDTEFQSRTTDLEVEKNRDEIKKALKKKDYGPFSSIVVPLYCVMSTLALLRLVWYIYYPLNQVLAHDANLEDIIASGNTTARMKALVMHTLETNSMIYNLITLVIIMLVLAAFGYLVFYKAASRHRSSKTLTVALYASDAMAAQERKVAELDTILNETLKECEEKIELLLQVNKKNEKQIQRLQHEKSEKEAELRVESAKLKFMTARYKEAAGRMKEMKDDVKEQEGHISKDTEAFKQNKALPQVPPIIRGADIVASTTLKVIPGTPLSFYWKQHGVRIHIPADALEPNTSSQTMSIQASLSGHFKLPDDMELVSAVYWVAFPGRFSCPIMVEVQHCASLEHSDHLSSLSFVTAKCTQKTLPYNFVPLSGGVFSTDSSYGAIELNHFSGVAVGGRTRKLYSLHTYYIPQGPVTWLTHFVVIKKLELCLKIVKEVYKIERAENGPKVIVEISGYEIAVDIADEGISLLSGWSVVPLASPKLPCAIVKSYEGGQDIPSIQLQVHWAGGNHTPQELSHQVNFSGVTPPGTYIRLIRQSTQLRALSESANQPQESLSQTDNIELYQLQRLDCGGGQDIRVMDQVSAKWTGVAIALRFGGHMIESIGRDAAHDVEQACRVMFQKWLAGEGKKPASWNVLIQALEDAKLGELARALNEALQ